jgi:hypothetical protein
MVTLLSVAVTCWLATFIAAPRRAVTGRTTMVLTERERHADLRVQQAAACAVGIADDPPHIPALAAVNPAPHRFIPQPVSRVDVARQPAIFLADVWRRFTEGHVQRIIDSPTIVLIGPVRAGKSTVGALLAARLGLPLHQLDALRDTYYREIDYDDSHAQRLRDEQGWEARYRYWKPFEAHAVERFLAEYPTGILDFGAGHSVQEDPVLFARVQRALAPYRNVVLLLPSPDLEESVRILKGRYGGLVSNGVDFDTHFVTHHANHDLATLVVYTEGKTPEETAAEILRRMI